MNDYQSTTLQIVDESKILTKDDFEIIATLKDELNHVFRNSQVFRTRTEMEVSVLNDIKFPTPDSKYWQAVREQNVMFQELVMLSYKYRKNQIKIKMLQRDYENESDELNKELIKIEIDKRNFIAKTHERVAKDRIREIKDWHEIKVKLLPQLKYGVENCNNHQLISYTQRWIKQSMLMGDKGSPAERNNLIGQLRSGILESHRRGILDEVLQAFNNEVKEKIYLEYQIKYDQISENTSTN